MGETEADRCVCCALGKVLMLKRNGLGPSVVLVPPQRTLPALTPPPPPLVPPE